MDYTEVFLNISLGKFLLVFIDYFYIISCTRPTSPKVVLTFIP